MMKSFRALALISILVMLFMMGREVRPQAQVGCPLTPQHYLATLTQAGTDPPVATVIDNTIGDIEWQRDSVGHYQAVLQGAFPVGLTWAKGTTFFDRADEHLIVAEFDVNASDVNVMRFSVESRESGVTVGVEDVLQNTPVEIVVGPTP